MRPPRLRCTLFPLIYPPHLLGSYKRQLYGFVLFSRLTKRNLASYVISVRRTKSLLTASFRFYLTIDTLAVQLYTSLSPRRVRDFHPLERAHGAQTKNSALSDAQIKTAASASETAYIQLNQLFFLFDTAFFKAVYFQLQRLRIKQIADAVSVSVDSVYRKLCPLSDVGGVIADSLIVFGDHQKVKNLVTGKVHGVLVQRISYFIEKIIQNIITARSPFLPGHFFPLHKR